MQSLSLREKVFSKGEKNGDHAIAIFVKLWAMQSKPHAVFTQLNHIPFNLKRGRLNF